MMRNLRTCYAELSATDTESDLIEKVFPFATRKYYRINDDVSVTEPVLYTYKMETAEGNTESGVGIVLFSVSDSTDEVQVLAVSVLANAVTPAEEE